MALAPALAELGLLVIVLWVIAFCALIATILAYVAGVIHGLPYPINQLAGPINSLAGGLSRAVGVAFTGVDRAIGWSLHIAARLMDITVQEFRRDVLGQYGIAKVTVSHATAINKLASQWRAQRAANVARSSQVKILERDFHGIDRQVRELERELSKGIGEDLPSRIKTLERELGRINTHTLPGIKARDKTFAGEIGDLYDWAKGKASLLGVGTFAFAVATSVASIGNGWLGCKENPFAKSGNPCGLWGDLAKFLPLLGLLTLSFDFPEFVKAADTVAEFIGPAVSSIEGAVIKKLDPLPPPL